MERIYLYVPKPKNTERIKKQLLTLAVVGLSTHSARLNYFLKFKLTFLTSVLKLL